MFENVGLISFKKNYGGSPSIQTGFDFVGKKSYATVIDCDLQDPPELIAKNLSKIKNNETIHFVRKRRDDPFLQIIYTKIAYFFLYFISNGKIIMNCNHFKILPPKVVHKIKKSKEIFPYWNYLFTMYSKKNKLIFYNRQRRIHGKSKFFQVALPMSRPAIVAGLSLVLMETISDFGTVEFFAVETLTLGIFNLWLGMNNLAAASQVALVSFTFIIMLLSVELIARKRQRFHDTEIKNLKSFKLNLNYLQSIPAILFCLIPVSFGFLLPVIILIQQGASESNNSDLFILIEIGANTLFIAGVSALIIVIISTILALTVKYKGNKTLPLLATLAGSGYAFPGVILALGTTYFFGFTQNIIFLKEMTFIGTFVALIFAYVSRFNAIGYGAINSGILRMPPNLMEASVTLGHSFENSIFKIIIPIIKPSILIAGILSFVDIAKELPITLLLRPFNFETLSTYVYQYAKDEMFEDSAYAALLIVFVGLIPIFLLNKALKTQNFFNNKK